MQQQKLRYLQSFLKRNEHKNIDDYVKLVRDRQQDIRSCYNQQIELDDDAFVEMVLLDAAFIVDFLSGIAEFENPQKEIKTSNDRYLMSQLLRDMILEENQLPYFVLDDIYNLSHPSGVEKGSPFIYVVARVFSNVVDKSKEPIQDMKIRNSVEIKHFVDFLRLSCLPSSPETKPNESEDDDNITDITSFPSVTELHEAGLKFKASKSKNLLDVSFYNGVLEIPRLHLMDTTETVFRNLMVFQQLHFSSNNYFTDYIYFMDGLINTDKDVDILVQNGIMYNGLGSSEKAATLINSLYSHIMVSEDNYYSGVRSALNKYKINKCNKWTTILKSKYFHHPWAAISVVYAIVLLILTILSVITGFIQIS